MCVVAARKLSSVIQVNFVIHLHFDPLTHLAADDGLTLLPAGISATFVLRSNSVELYLLRSDPGGYQDNAIMSHFNKRAAVDRLVKRQSTNTNTTK